MIGNKATFQIETDADIDKGKFAFRESFPKTTFNFVFPENFQLNGYMIHGQLIKIYKHNQNHRNNLN